jgi:hypothetical protein
MTAARKRARSTPPSRILIRRTVPLERVTVEIAYVDGSCDHYITTGYYVTLRCCTTAFHNIKARRRDDYTASVPKKHKTIRIKHRLDRYHLVITGRRKLCEFFA